MIGNSQQSLNKLPNNRELLYHLVWTEPAEEIAKQYGITITYLAKQCIKLSVPRPLAGFWRAVEKGNSPKIPALPILKKIENTRSSKQNGAISHFENNHNSLEKTLANEKFNKKINVLQNKSNEQKLIKELESYLLASPKTKYGYYKPTKKKLLDINVSESGLNYAILFLTKFFNALNKKGYLVSLSACSEGLRRADIEIAEVPQTRGVYWESLWHPYTPSVIFIKERYIGFTLAEMTEYVPAKEVNGRYVRDEKMINWTKGKNASSFGSGFKHNLPTGRFLLQLYSPYNSTQWKTQFKQTKQCGLVSQISKMIEALNKAVPIINKQLVEESVRAEQRRIQYAIDLEKYEKQELIRKSQEAHKKSLIELQSIMAQWIEDKRIEQFFQDVECGIADLDNEQKEKIKARIKLAKQFLFGNKATDRLISWKTPTEILNNI